MNPKPSSSIDSAIRSGDSSSSKPSASSTSALPGQRRHRAVAVLRDAGAGGCGDERRRGRDVERLAAVAAGAGRVDEVVAFRLHGDDVRAHRLGRAGDLVGRLALQPQRDEEAADLRRRRVARHDRVHHLARLRRASGRRRRAAARARPGSSEEVPDDVAAERREHRLGMELHAVDAAARDGARPSPRRRRPSPRSRRRRARSSPRASGSGRRGSPRAGRRRCRGRRARRRSPCRARARARGRPRRRRAARSPGGRGRRRASATRGASRSRIAGVAPASSGRPGPGRDDEVRGRELLRLVGGQTRRSAARARRRRARRTGARGCR